MFPGNNHVFSEHFVSFDLTSIFF